PETSPAEHYYVAELCLRLLPKQYEQQPQPRGLQNQATNGGKPQDHRADSPRGFVAMEIKTWCEFRHRECLRAPASVAACVDRAAQPADCGLRAGLSAVVARPPSARANLPVPFRREGCSGPKETAQPAAPCWPGHAQASMA